MTKTKVDDFLLEMISPKVKEIEEKFSNNQPLTQDDINTLLLKSQYNHINHLDEKLNEVTADVATLKTDFKFLENSLNTRMDSLENSVNQRFETFEQRFETFEQRFETFEQRFETFEQKIDATIQKALNKNMMMLIGSMGFFLALSKIIDMVTK